MAKENVCASYPPEFCTIQFNDARFGVCFDWLWSFWTMSEAEELAFIPLGSNEDSAGFREPFIEDRFGIFGGRHALPASLFTRVIIRLTLTSMQLGPRIHHTSRFASLWMPLRDGREGSESKNSWSLQTRPHNYYRGGTFSIVAYRK